MCTSSSTSTSSAPSLSQKCLLSPWATVSWSLVVTMLFLPSSFSPCPIPLLLTLSHDLPVPAFFIGFTSARCQRRLCYFSHCAEKPFQENSRLLFQLPFSPLAVQLSSSLPLFLFCDSLLLVYWPIFLLICCSVYDYGSVVQWESPEVNSSLAAGAVIRHS